MSEVLQKAPAKINLFLKVNYKRPDGYHDITTVFERINLFDDIILKDNVQNQNVIIACDCLEVPLDHKNIAFQAALLFKEKFNIKRGINIHITKRIPVAAGLGGGSSDAAATLLGLNKLWNLGLSIQDLLPLAEQLGSDVPFFLYDVPLALGRQRGNKIEPLCFDKTLWHVLVASEVQLYSSRIYQGINLELTRKSADAKIFISHLKSHNLDKIGQLLANDLEEVIFNFQPQLKSLKKRLKDLGSSGVMVSGSGPTVFGLIPTQKDAYNLMQNLAKRFKRVFLVKTY